MIIGITESDSVSADNFWNWFQESKGSEKGSGTTGITCPEESTRLCLMFYKFIRKYKIRNVFDVSCSKNLDWMPSVLKKSSKELWGFKYQCSEAEEVKMEENRRRLSDLSFVNYVSDKWWRRGFPKDLDLVFAWDVLPHTAYGRVWNFFVNIKKQEVKYVLVDNYPGILNDPVSAHMSIY